jgi:adenylate kinase
MLREAARAGTELGRKTKDIMDRGELVSDDIVVAIIAERLCQDTCFKGAVFDGFPRTIAQAEALDRLLAACGKQIDRVIELKVNDEALINRVDQRFHDGGPVRADDTPETLRYRLGVYYRNTAPLLGYYGQQGKLAPVDGMAPIDEVAKAIAGILDHPMS